MSSKKATKPKVRSMIKRKKRSKDSLSKKMMSYSKMDSLDQLLLKVTATPYNKILAQIKIGKKKLSDERKLALRLGTRILAKAKEVRDSLMSSSSKNRR